VLELLLSYRRLPSTSQREKLCFFRYFANCDLLIQNFGAKNFFHDFLDFVVIKRLWEKRVEVAILVVSRFYDPRGVSDHADFSRGFFFFNVLCEFKSVEHWHVEVCHHYTTSLVVWMSLWAVLV
jgi:hypothetical protein